MNNSLEIFDKKPFQWGLRGDPHLWGELRTALEKEAVFIAKSDFENWLLGKFNDLISNGKEVAIEDALELEHYPKRGMSGGIISLKWWEETGLPILIQRYKERN